MDPSQVLPLRVRVEPGLMLMKALVHILYNSRAGGSSSDVIEYPVYDTQDASSIWPIDWTLASITTADQSGPGSNDIMRGTPH